MHSESAILVFRVMGSRSDVLRAMLDAKAMNLNPRFIRASSGGPDFTFIAEVSASESQLNALEGLGWSTWNPEVQPELNVEPLVEITKNPKKLRQQKKKRKPLRIDDPPRSRSGHNVRGLAHWEAKEAIRVERASKNQAPADAEAIQPLILVSRRGTRIEARHRCKYCTEIHEVTWRYRESSEGEVRLCASCRDVVYLDSFGAASSDAMLKAVYRQRSKG